jgi:Ca2+-binding RTX toxin-like protein
VVGISKLALPGVTIASADLLHPAVITALNVSSSSGLAFRDLELRADRAGGDNAFRVSGSHDVSFTRLDVHGSLDGDPSNDVSGFLVRTSSNISLTDSEFRELSFAFEHLDTDHLTLSGNEFHNLRSDGIRGGGSSFITITGNRFHDFHPIAADHPDAIQFWTSNTTTNAHDILVANNLIYRGDGQQMQGVFISDEVAGVYYEHVLVEGNLISGGLFHGITVASAFDVTVRGNIVQGFLDNKSWIRLENVDGATVSNNQANLVTTNVVDKNIVQSDNILLPLAGDHGAWAVAAWHVAQAAGLPQAAPIETAGSDASETLFGAAAADQIIAGAGDDTIIDPAGANYLRGGDGADYIRGGFDFDDINGNAGDDTASGGLGDDWVVGGRGNDSLSGGDGADIVYGNLGADTCVGGDGADVVRGGQDADVLQGGAGADFLSGDKGDDTMTGGAGADAFHSFADAGVDRITDFSVAEGDRVVLDAGTSYSVEQVGADTVVHMSAGDVILVGVSMASLTGAWITVG